MKLHEIMHAGTYAVGDTDLLGPAYTTMVRSHIRHLPVTRAGKVVGMLSERDVLAARARAGTSAWWELPVAEAMTEPVQTAGPDDSLTEAAGRMAAAKLGALPVVRQGALLGIVTVGDVLEAEVREAMGAPAARTAADVMTPYPFAVQVDTMLVDAVAIMHDQHIRHLPVVDIHSAVIGMLSDRDVRGLVGDPEAFVAQPSNAVAQYTVQDVMTRPCATVTFDTPLREIAARFADQRIGAVPVLDRFGALLGIVSYVDLARAMARD